MTMKNTASKGKQSGLTILEFTLIALALLMLIFGAFEFSRYVFSMQMLNEMTRKAARLAVVCSIDDRNDIVNLPGVVGHRPSGFLETNLSIEYLDIEGEPVLDLQDDFANIRFVKAQIEGYKFRFIPLLSFIGDAGAITAPSFPTILPTESLGIVRPNINNENGAKEDC